MTSQLHAIAPVFSIIWTGRTYTRMLYLVLGLPLGIIYTAFFFGAISVGLLLSPIGIGILFLIGLAMGSWILLGIERELAVLLIGVELDPLILPKSESSGAVANIKAYLKSSGTWKSLAYLLFRLPLGLFSAAVVFLAIAVAATLTAAPITFLLSDLDLGFWLIDQRWESFALAAFGPPAGLLALHIIDRVALGYARLVNAAVTS